MADVLLLGGVLGVAFVGAVGVLLWRSQPVTEPRTALDHAFAHAAEVHPTLTATFGNALQAATLTGTAHGVSVSAQQIMKDESHGQGRIEYHMELHLGGGAGGLSAGKVEKAGWFTTIGVGRVFTGDEAFDDAFIVSGPEPLTLLAQLSAERRQALRSTPSWRLEGGSWKYLLPGRPSREHVVKALADGAELVEALKEATPTEEGLRALVDADPLPEVRKAVLDVWLRRGAPPEADLRRWAAGEGPIALMAARALGQAGAPFLVDLLEQPHQATRAAILLARLDVDHGATRCEEVLLDGLQSATADVVEALGRVGGRRSVAPLQALDGGLRAEARQAVASIQQRLRASGGAAGGVALAEGEGGQLSVAPKPGATETAR